jgi:plastocyanin
MQRSANRIFLEVASAIVLFAQQSSFDARPSHIAEPPTAGSAPITFGSNVDSPRPEGIVATSGSTFEVKVGASGDNFAPSTVNITIGDTVHWTWVGFGHTVTSGSPCTANSTFCSPSDANCANDPTSNPPSTYSHVFNLVGVFPYFCRIHCLFGMTGTINVAPAITAVTFGVNGFAMNGQSTPSTSVTIQSTSSLTTQFQNPNSVAANSTGAISFSDPSPGGARFYRATFP